VRAGERSARLCTSYAADRKLVQCGRPGKTRHRYLLGVNWFKRIWSLAGGCLPGGDHSCQMTTVLKTTVTTVGPSTTSPTAPKTAYRAWPRLLPAPGSVGGQWFEWPGKAPQPVEHDAALRRRDYLRRNRLRLSGPYPDRPPMVLSVKCVAWNWADGLSGMDAIPFSAEMLSAERGDRKSCLLLSGWRIGRRWRRPLAAPLPLAQCASGI
jgi:hypothetical protein